MVEVTHIELFEVAVPTVLAPADEIRRVQEWLSYSSAMREVSLFVLYRMWRDLTYMDIDSEDIDALPGQPKYESWSAFLKDLLRTVEVSRSTVYSRLRTYALLEWLEYTEHRMVRMMAEKPGLYEKVLAAIFLWDQEARVPSGVKTNEFGDLHDPEFKERVREFLSSLDAFDSVGDAIAHVTHDILGKPMMNVVFKNRDEIAVYFEEKAYDEELGEEITVNTGMISFYSDEEVPEWLVEAIRAKYRIG